MSNADAIYDAAWAASYERRAEAAIPGREGLYRLCVASLHGIPDDARILVVGCGTGTELLALAGAFPRAHLTGLEPAAAMLAHCERRVAECGFAERVALRAADLAGFDGAGPFDAATSILVSQHIADDAGAAAFFATIASLLRPGGRLYTADLHVALGQDRERMLALWRVQSLLAGIEPELVHGMLEKFRTDIRPRDESTIAGFLERAGFGEIAKPFSSLLYGAWTARRFG